MAGWKKMPLGRAGDERSWLSIALFVAACSSDSGDRGASSAGAGGGGSGASGGSSGTPGSGGSTSGGAGGTSAGASGSGGATAGSTGSGGAAGSFGGSDGGTKQCAHDGAVADAVVSSGDSLQAAVDAATNGGVIWIGPGTYSCLQIEQRAFSAAAPLIIRKDPTRTGGAQIVPGSCWFAVRVVGSSYVVLDGLHVDGGGISVYVDQSDHVILNELEVDNSGQEGVQVRNDSSYVDILRSHVHHTGTTEPKWAECVYVGTGSDQDFPDHTEYVWIEGNDLHHCGAAEGVNIKPEVFHTTVRGNTIHDIAPGTADQYNESALTVEGETRDYLRTTPRGIRLEDNEIHNVSLGRWANCVMVGGTGVTVVGNNVHDCEERGIYGNGFGNLGFPLALFGNNVTNAGTQAVWVDPAIELNETDPGPNPQGPQDWYCR